MLSFVQRVLVVDKLWHVFIITSAVKVKKKVHTLHSAALILLFIHQKVKLSLAFSKLHYEFSSFVLSRWVRSFLLVFSQSLHLLWIHSWWPFWFIGSLVLAPHHRGGDVCRSGGDPAHSQNLRALVEVILWAFEQFDSICTAQTSIDVGQRQRHVLGRNPGSGGEHNVPHPTPCWKRYCIRVPVNLRSSRSLFHR